jgi:type II secretory pathway component PulJ
MNKAGFSLLELVSYIMLASFFSLLLFRFSVNNLSSCALLKQKCALIASQLFIKDLLMRDIMQASPEKKDWQIAQNSCIFQTSEQSIGWQIKNNKLYRIIGAYNFQKGTWRKKSKMLIANNISELKCEPIMIDDQMQGIHIAIADQLFDAYLFNRSIA